MGSKRACGLGGTSELLTSHRVVSGSEAGNEIVAGDKGNLYNPRLYQMALRFLF